MNKTIILKSIDGIVGRCACFLSAQRPASLVPTVITRILLIRPGGIGDAVLLLPVVESLRLQYPNAHIAVLAERRNSAIFGLSNHVNAIYHYDRPLELLAVLRNSYDVVIDTEQWHRLSAIVARLVNAPVAIGYATNDRKKAFTHPVPYSLGDHEITSFYRLLAPLGIPDRFDREQTFVRVTSSRSEEIQRLSRTCTRQEIVALFPGGSIREKRWETDRFHQTARRLTERGYGIVVVGGRDDVLEGRKITRGLANCVNACGTLPLAETAAVLKLSSLLITGDSGIMHLGYALGTKVVALFGPGSDSKWAPRSSRVIVVDKHLPCSPCSEYGYTKKCKNGFACMKDISVDEVFDNALRLLEGH